MADYPTITKISEIDATTPAGTEVASKIDDSIRQIKSFLATFLAVSHADAGGIKTDAVAAAAIPNGSIVEAKLANLAVTAAKIADATITAAKLANLAVETAKINDLAVTAAKLAADSVTTAKILDANVTTAKILDANVTVAKLAADAVETAKIKDAQVTEAKLAALSVSSGKMKFASGADANPTLMVGGTSGGAEATIGGVLKATLAAGVLTFTLGSDSSSASARTPLVAYALLQEKKSVGTNAGTSVTGANNTRGPWSEVSDATDMVAVSASQFTIRNKGNYWISISAPASNAVGLHRCRLTKITGGTTDVMFGSCEQCPASTTTRSVIRGMLSVADDSTTYEVRHFHTTGVATTGLGAAVNDTANEEVYTIVELIRV